MLFNSVNYLIFLVLTLAIYWTVSRKIRLIFLLIASYFFYMSWKPGYVFLLLAITIINYYLGLLISKFSFSKQLTNEDESSFILKQKKLDIARLFLIVGLAVNLGILGLFKYTNFFLSTVWSISQIFSKLPCQSNQSDLLPIVLPLGISFFVFEFIHYLVDVYHGQEPIKSPLNFALFATFFPSQIAGPIKRFEDFTKQMTQAKIFSLHNINAGLLLILEGMFKKVVLGDNLAPLVNLGFEHSNNISCLDAWMTVLAFTLQIYYDFSGYTDIGRGSALCFGYKLPENFNMPYIASNISDFWHRWHISLSTWLRDYLYIPFGGSKMGNILQMRNLLFTMLLGGLWHGASWTFVLWGAYHGIGLIIYHLATKMKNKFGLFNLSKNKNPITAYLPKFLAWSITFVFVMFGWVLFRSQTIEEAGQIYHAMLNTAFLSGSAYDWQVFRIFGNSILPLTLLVWSIYVVLKILFNQDKIELFSMLKTKFENKMYLPVKICFIAFISCLILGMAPEHAIPFIYFQF